MEKICILGGGASALLCASFIENKNVTIYEKAERVGKKILATGNGRCNLTNLNMNKCSYNQSLEKYFNRFDVSETLKFFNKIGLETYADDEGRVYPVSNTATSVLSVLKNYVDSKENIKINTEKELFNIKSDKNGFLIQFSDNSEEFFNKAIIAMGNDTNLEMFIKFRIKYKEFKPSLCSIKTEKHKSLSGVRVDNVCVKCEDLRFEEIGEILFKDDGISGIVVFNLSSYISRSHFGEYKITLDFLPNLSFDEVSELLKKRRSNLQFLTVENFLTGLFHKQINFELIKELNVDMGGLVNSLSDKDIKVLANKIKNYQLTTKGFYDNNQVCSGGILLSELDCNLQSKQNSGLYFIGEVVDVDGVCGGYNLQWAWTSGKIVGESV